MHLAINEETSVTVDPTIYDVDSGIDVLAGERYSFSASGMWQDGNCKCDANGWNSPLFSVGRILNRLRGRNYFLLCLNLDREKSTYAGVGTERKHWDVPGDAKSQPRRLHFFANDWAFMYSNNKALPAADGGPLVVAVKRIA
jgi:hypothetical protein